MKELDRYEELEVEVIVFKSKDVITNSLPIESNE